MDVKGTESAVDIIWAGALGHVRWHGCNQGHIHNPVTGEILGGFYRGPYTTGYAVHTKPYGGYVREDELVIDIVCA